MPYVRTYKDNTAPTQDYIEKPKESVSSEAQEESTVNSKHLPRKESCELWRLTIYT